MINRRRNSQSRKVLSIVFPLIVVALTVCGFLFRDKLTALWQVKFGGKDIELPSGKQEISPEWEVPGVQENKQPEVLPQTPTPGETGTSEIEMQPEENVPEETTVPALSDAERNIAEIVGDISDSPLWKQLLGMERPLLMFVRMLDDVSHGERPMFSLGFLRKEERFEASGKNISQATAARYASLVNMIAAADMNRAAKVYLHLEPALQEAYKELGYTDGHVRELLSGAVRQILEVPVLSEDAQLVSRGTPGLYSWAEESLESLTPVQKLFLRLGRENCATVRRQVEAFGDAVGLWE